MHHLMVYGLQRSGTNWLEKLIDLNFVDVSRENVGYARSLPLHKHFRLYDEMTFVPASAMSNL